MWSFNVLHLWVFFAGLFAIGYWYIQNQFLYWPKRGVPFCKPHWLFGNFGDLICAKIPLAELSVNLYKKFKGERFAGLWHFFSPKFYAIDPGLIRDILVKDFGTWSSRGIAVNLDADPLSAHLINLDGKKWKSVRAKLTPVFTSGKLKQMHYLLLECGKKFEKHLDALVATGGLVEAREMSARYMTDVIGSCIFGLQTNSLGDENCKFRKMGKKIFEPTFKRKILDSMRVFLKPLYKLLKIAIHDKEVTDFFLQLTKETLDYREKNNVQRNDFIGLLRHLRNTGDPLDEDEIQFDDKLLAAQVFVFFTAGFETSSSMISFCLHELAVNGDIQDRLREEVHRTKVASGGEITWDGLQNMKYLDMVFQETLRKYPPFPVIARTCIKPYRIPGTNVELSSGTECYVPIYALHHDPDYFPEPEKFDPERFTDESKSQRPAFVFIPFGGGPRVCIALRFAEQQIKLALVKLVDKFKISLSEKSLNPLPFEPKTIFLFPKGGIWIRISKDSSG